MLSTASAAATTTDTSPPLQRILVDRHMEKNGGTSARWLLHRAEVFRQCAYWGYGHDWASAVLPLLSEMAASSVPQPPLCIEAHTSVGHDSLRRVARLCERHPTRVRCVFWLRWREPLAYYTSFFIWGVLPRLELATSALAPGAFLRWVRAHPNLQSELMLTSGAATEAMRVQRHGGSGDGNGSGAVGWFDRRWRSDRSSARRARVLRALSLYTRQGSVLSTTERLEDGASAVGALLDWPAALTRLGGADVPLEVATGAAMGCRRVHAWQWWCTNRSLPWRAQRIGLRAAVCPDAAACAAAVAASASVDSEIHRIATEWEHRRLAQRAQRAQPVQQAQVAERAERAAARGGDGVRANAPADLASGGPVRLESAPCAWRPMAACPRAHNATCALPSRRQPFTRSRGRRCVRQRSWSLLNRTAAAPSFAPGSGACYVGGSAAAVRALRMAWAEHPRGGRVLVGSAMGELVSSAGARGVAGETSGEAALAERGESTGRAAAAARAPSSSESTGRGGVGAVLTRDP